MMATLIYKADGCKRILRSKKSESRPRFVMEDVPFERLTSAIAGTLVDGYKASVFLIFYEFRNFNAFFSPKRANYVANLLQRFAVSDSVVAAFPAICNYQSQINLKGD